MKLVYDRVRNTKLELSIPAGHHEVEVPEVLAEQLLTAGFKPAPAQPSRPAKRSTPRSAPDA